MNRSHNTGDYWVPKGTKFPTAAAGALFRNRSETSREEDPQLTPSQTYGVVTQEKYMELSGNRVVLNTMGANKMKRVYPGDFIIHLRSFQGGLELSRSTGKVSNAYTVLKPSPLVDTAYFRWLLKSDAFINGLSSLTDQLRDGQSISFGTFSKLALPLPPLETQHRIAEYLNRETQHIDESITRIDKVVDLLEERREASRMSTLFGSKSGAQTFSQSRLGPQIPSHWAESKFGLEFRESSEFVGTSPIGPLLSISEYRGVELNNRTDGQRPSETVSHYRTLRRGQLAVNTMWLNHGGLAVSDLDGYISPDYRAYDISPKLDPQFAHFLMRSRPMVDYFSVVSTGVRPNAQRVTSTVLQNVPVVVPPMEEQKKISQLLSQEGAETSLMISKANLVKGLLEERRSALITAAVTGKIEV